VCDLETSRMGAPYIYDISRLRVKVTRNAESKRLLSLPSEHTVLRVSALLLKTPY